MISLRLFFFQRRGIINSNSIDHYQRKLFSKPKTKNSLIQLSKNLISKSQFFLKKKGMEKERKQKPQTSSEVIIALICCNHSKQANKRNKKNKEILRKKNQNLKKKETSKFKTMAPSRPRMVEG